MVTQGNPDAQGESTPVEAKQPCPHDDCGSSSGVTYYDDLHAHCFSCSRTWSYNPEDMSVIFGGTKNSLHNMQPTPPTPEAVLDILSKGSHLALPARRITQATCRKWDYRVFKNSKGDWIQAAIYCDKVGRPHSAKLRNVGTDGSKKAFTHIGDTSQSSPLWGRHLWGDGNAHIKMVVITEGEIDALSVSQAFGNKFPVVSIRDGAAVAKKNISSELEWLSTFERVVLMFDSDEAGRSAAEKTARILPPGKACIAVLPEGFKDPNELLVAGKQAEITAAAWNAKVYRPDGIVEASSLMGEVLTPPVAGLSWPWEFLTEWTYGRRYGEVYTFGGGTGSGKSDLLIDTIAHTIKPISDGGCGENCAIFSWEAGPVGTTKAVLGKLKQRRFHIPDPNDLLWTPDEIRDAVDYYEEHCAKLFINDHFGAVDWDNVKERVRFLAHSENVKHVVLDPLTALAAVADDERRMLEKIMAEAAALAQELNICMYLVSHLATPEGASHEEGGRVELRHLKGSRSIVFWSFFVFGLERDQQAEDLEERQTSTIRCLKDRYTGNSLGKTQHLVYNVMTGAQEVPVVNYEHKDTLADGADLPAPD